MTDEEVADAYRRYGSLVLRRCRRILRDDAAGEDALQEVFVRLMRYGHAFHQAESKVLWLYRVADRCCFDLLARRGARAEASTLEHAPEPAHRGTGALEDREVILRFLASWSRLARIACDSCRPRGSSAELHKSRARFAQGGFGSGSARSPQRRRAWR